MFMEDIATLTLAGALDGLKKKEFSSVELNQALVDSIDKKDGDLKAYLKMDPEYILKQAAESDQKRAAGDDSSLLGVPIAIKDLINVKGESCSCASRQLEKYNALYDATVAAKLRYAGAVFAGRTNMDEFAMGSSTENSAFQITRNPHNLECVPGGSSGGSAAAVAGGEAIAALGTDTGGSIRQPASFCGCVGMKPSYGRVSRYGVTAYASSLDQVGPMTKTVEDAAILLKELAGFDPHDGTTLDVKVPDYQAHLTGGMKGLKIGLPKEFYVDGSDPEVSQAVLKAVESCRAAGAEIVDVSLPHTEYAIAVYYILATAEASANLARFDGVRFGHRAESPKSVFDLYAQSRAEGFGTEVKRRIILGTYVLSSGYYDAYYGKAQKARTLIREDYTKAFEKCDVLMTPVSPTPAYKIGEASQDPLKMYLGDIFTVPANLAGICGISLPCGSTRGGLPVGLQILGPAFGEERILKTAYAFEQMQGA
ncbi:MAG: Asp-tRNA(Asn)/Glu-tRNA(Gln) amidotransferase subunit GatA [Kiritimatiellae bacterium]|jgi:aspartyl-tRNA(Asn)/glutamyl-tRNA(Gln) amidotransferase subunit A|nr:Asp-tRNA(Asn)/Glu-tRNA(Gln) amidotransferase subunit GatA [Kiritimatiellia bacterium]